MARVASKRWSHSLSLISAVSCLLLATLSLSDGRALLLLVAGVGELLASAAGLRCGTLPRLTGKSQGMLSANSGVVTEMPDGPHHDDLMLVPAGGMVPRRISADAPEISPA